MQGLAFNLSRTIVAVNSADAARAVNQAHRMYARALASWASDALALRRRGVHLQWPASSALRVWGRAA